MFRKSCGARGRLLSRVQSWGVLIHPDGTFEASRAESADLLLMLKYRAVLQMIAGQQRPDGTWNRDRAACQALAEKVLKETA